MFRETTRGIMSQMGIYHFFILRFYSGTEGTNYFNDFDYKIRIKNCWESTPNYKHLSNHTYLQIKTLLRWCVFGEMCIYLGTKTKMSVKLYNIKINF